MDPTSRAWFGLLLLGAASVGIAAGGAEILSASVSGALVLIAAWMKARIVLSSYLGLREAPTWLAGFNWSLGLFCLLLLGLYLIPSVRF